MNGFLEDRRPPQYLVQTVIRSTESTLAFSQALKMHLFQELLPMYLQFLLHSHVYHHTLDINSILLFPRLGLINY